MATSVGEQQSARAVGPGPVAAAVIVTGGALLVLSVPIPALVADLLLAANLAGAVAILMVALVTPRPVELSSFPSVVVLASLARILLCLIVARLVVATGQAGQLATTLAAVTALNNPVASLGTLITVGIVQFVVVTAGVGRLAEVAARFALDALPGKQMALDSALSTQKLSATESHREAVRLETEANFYGALDGAARFLRGETVAVLAIILLTPLMRLAAGGAGSGTDWTQWALLTAGHGLIILLPALLMGAAAAIMAARAGSASPLTADVMEQLMRSPAPLGAAAAACLLLALVPGMGKLPLLAVAVGLGVWAWLLMRKQAQGQAVGADTKTRSEAAITSAAANPAPQIHLGWGLLDLITDGGEQLLDQLSELRQRMSAELGFSVPAFVVRDSPTLGLYEYSFVFRGSIVDKGEVFPVRRLAVGGALEGGDSLGIVVTFADGRPAVWVMPEQEQTARNSGCELFSAQEVILHHLRRALGKYAAELFDTQRASEILNDLARTHPATVAEARGAGVTASVLAAVGQQLLKSGLPVADYLTMTEVVAGSLPTTTDAEQLTASVRQAMPRAITELVAPDGALYALELAADEEEMLSAGRVGDTQRAVLTPQQAAAWRQLLANLVAQYRRADRPIVLLCSAAARRAVEPAARGFVPDLVVVEPDEVLGETRIQRLHQITGDDLMLAGEGAE